MDSEKPVVLEVVKTRKPGTFQPGGTKPPGSGRKKAVLNRASWNSREVAMEQGFHPLRIAIDVIMKGTLPALNGQPARIVSDDERLKTLRDILQYMLPKLSAQQITGANDGPVALAAFDVTQLMADSEMLEAAQKLALALASGTEHMIDSPTLGITASRLYKQLE
jgi:hypothetical protein